MCPSFLQMSGHGGATWVEEQQTRNWPNCTVQKRSPKRLIVLLEPKKWSDTTQKFFSGALRRIGALPPLSLRTGVPHFQIRSGATVCECTWVYQKRQKCAIIRKSLQGHCTETREKSGWKKRVFRWLQKTLERNVKTRCWTAVRSRHIAATGKVRSPTVDNRAHTTDVQWWRWQKYDILCVKCNFSYCNRVGAEWHQTYLGKYPARVLVSACKVFHGWLFSKI